MNFRRLKLRCGRLSVKFAQTRPFGGALVHDAGSKAGPGVPPAAGCPALQLNPVTGNAAP